MKTSFFKLFLPAFAILLAIGLAFATEESNLPLTGYINSPSGPVEIQTDCPDTGEGFCYEGLYQVFKDSTLMVPIRDWENNPVRH